MKSPLIYFHDEKMTKRYEVNEEGFPIIDWGEIIPGKRMERTLYVMNESKDRLTLRQPFTTSDELALDTYPTSLKSEEAGVVKLTYTSNPEKIEAHRASWGFEVIVG